MAALAAATCLLNSSAQSPRLIPLQARLTDAAGKSIPDGARVIQFQIFEDPTNTTPVWSGEVHRTTINGGLLNVSLGAKNPFPPSRTNEAGAVLSFFDATLYLEITVASFADGPITTEDSPLRPRQAIVPVVFAAEAGRAREADRLQGFGVSTLPTAVPVGGVLMWWGTRAAIPAGFELCDGSLPSTPGATLATSKPDLRDRFPKGALEPATDVASSPATGGTHTIAARASLGTALTVAQLPQHRHGVDIATSVAGSHRHSITTGAGDAGTRDRAADGDRDGRDSTAQTNFAGDHTHRVVGSTGDSGFGEAHSHTVPEHDNRPAFLEMFFIIRVK